MKRRDFIKKSGLLTAGSILMPTILPTGRLFAATGSRKVDHVVFCLFAGGIRTLESVHKSEGNLMPYTLSGSESVSSDIIEGLTPVPAPTTRALQESATLFKGFRYKNTETIHYTGHAISMTGVYAGNIQIMKPLEYPTVFEYYRKHSEGNKSGINAWWISNQAGPFPYLNYSNHKDYGPLYGANLLQPTTLFNLDLSDLQLFSNEELKQVDDMRQYLNRNYDTSSAPTFSHGIINTEEDRYRISKFLVEQSKLYRSQPRSKIWNLGEAVNEDIVTIHTATEVLKAFQPELLVVNMQDSDVGHSNFTKYCSNLRIADFGLYKLWETIQSIPEMKDNTMLIAAPEFGRNRKPNTIVDDYGRYAIDHTGDEMSQEIFCLVAGPPGVVHQGLEINEDYGSSIDIVPTIAEVLGFRQNIPRSRLKGHYLDKAFKA